MATNFDSYIQLLTGTDSTTFTDANKLIYANYVYQDILSEISDIDPSRYTRTATTDFTANATNFQLPSTSSVYDPIAGQVQSIWVKYTSSGNWVRVEFYPKNDINPNTTYSQDSPVGWWEKNNYYILPVTTTTVTDGIRINYSLRPTALAAITTEPDFDKEFWHLIPLGVAARYLRAGGDYELADRYEADFRNGIKMMRQKVYERGNANTRFVPAIQLTSNGDF